MAIVQSLAIGNARKSAGNLTFQTVHGRTIAREKPLYVTNPNTPAQQATRQIMRNLVAAWRGFYFQARPYFTVLPPYGSAYNQFIKMNHSIGSSSWFNTFDNDWNLPVGAVVSNGKYGDASLSKSYNTGTSSFVVGVADLQLRTELAVNDKIVVFAQGDEVPGVKIITRSLSESDISALQNGNTISIPSGITGAILHAAVLYYSSARGVSSTAVASADY